MNASSSKSTPEQKAARAARVQALKEAMRQRILVLDGAMGTQIFAKNLQAKDFGDPQHEGCIEYLAITRPEVIQSIHEAYFSSGADITETNTFGGTPLVLDEFGLKERAFEINKRCAELARAAAANFGPNRWVAGSMGPTTKAISVVGGITFEQLAENYEQQATALMAGGVDYLLLETCNDTRTIKAAVYGIERAFKQAGEQIPVAVSVTIEAMGTMLAGQSIDALATALEHLDLLYIGLNCATGPEFMTDHIRTLSGITRFPVSCVPNAGLPDENGKFLETPQMLSKVLKRFAEEGWLNVVGGCCGTHTGHIEALSQAVKGLKPRSPNPVVKSRLSGVDCIEIEDIRPIIVGERTNVIGSKKFKELIAAGQLEEAGEIARAQVKRGAQLIDVCLANPDRDELDDMRRFLNVAVKKVRVPIMIDSTDEKVIAEALTYCQGKAIINSVNLEDGLERFEKVVPLARQFGAALVVGCIDETGMAVSSDRKLQVAERSFEILTHEFGVRPEDIYFDPLVFPCASGDQQYVGSAVETIEGVRKIKQRFPQCKTVLGISNVSFGLPTAGREALNAVFLYHCVQAGLDLALVNSEKLERYPQIPDTEKKLCEDLIYNRTADPITPFAAHFREKKVVNRLVSSKLSLDERLSQYIIEGTRDGLVKDLDLKLAEGAAPLDIINGPLMKGMDEVGRLFGNNELIVAEVLQSAEAMKAAVGYLEPKMDKSQVASRGKMLLATVKGDVHDIGKNLVEIILANNGFEIVNLGIKVPPEKLVAAVKEHEPDLIGLSGLLVKSAHQMVTTAQDLSQAGVSTPVLVGGAALSRNFVDRQIAPAYSGTVAYAQDAMAGLELAKQIVDPQLFEKLKGDLSDRRQKLKEEAVAARPVAVKPVNTTRAASIAILDKVPAPPDFERHVLMNTPLDQIWRFINPVMLYGRHFGVKGSVARVLGTADERKLSESPEGLKGLELKERIDAIKNEMRQGVMKPKAVFQFFRARAGENSIELTDPGVRFEFSRSDKDAQLCLSDFVRPSDDNLCLFVVTAGEGIRQLAERYKAEGDFTRMHGVQALALETAEAYAEMLHSQIRSMWGIPDAPEMTMLERFRAEYAGKRYSFGYPACPRLEDQEKLFQVLRPQEIGVELTDGCMMEPEASVSALVFHHPQAQYFSV